MKIRRRLEPALLVLALSGIPLACGSGGSGDDGASGSGSSATGGSSNGTSGGDSGDSGSGGSRAGSGTGGSTTGTGGLTATGGASGSAGSATAGSTSLCSDGTCVCSNGLDDDDDGLTDGFDSECTGPYDNDEGSFATGIPGDNRDPKWQDCFFDGNSGAGDDSCRYPTDCLTGDIAPEDAQCEVTQSCLDYCVDRTPNGCDCFGCCTVQDETGANVDVYTVSTCSLESLGDEAACPRCTKSIDCQNECGECELCPGKTVEDLPESCTPDMPPTGAGGADGAGGAPGEPPPGYTCDEGLQVCSETIVCPADTYCQLGCCVTAIVR